MSLVTTLTNSTKNALLTAGISGAAVTVTKAAMKKDKSQMLTMEEVKLGSYQALASFAANFLQGMILPMLPPGVKMVEMLVKPFLTGAGAALIARVIDEKKFEVYDILISVGAEIAASYAATPIGAALGIPPSLPAAAALPARRDEHSARSRSKVTG